MFLDELERAFQWRSLRYLTCGLCEPHGPHNAVRLDAFPQGVTMSLSCSINPIFWFVRSNHILHK